jgi:hypothetical protein
MMRIPRLNSDLRQAAEPGSEPPSPLVPAPRVKVVKTETGQAIELVPDGSGDLDTFRVRFLAALGTTEPVIAETLLQHLLNVLHADPKKPLDAATANLSLALLHRIGPRDELEAMLGCQLVTAHVAAMDAARRAVHVDQVHGGRQAYLSLSRKLMNLYVAQLDALNRHRGRGSTQKMNIERVSVAPGAARGGTRAMLANPTRGCSAEGNIRRPPGYCAIGEAIQAIC